MPLPMENRVRVGDRGELELPEGWRGRWGLDAGAEFLIEETSSSLVLRRADPVLTRVYVEPTAACNLTCRTCVRNSWDEPLGTMAMATYQRLIEGLRTVQSLRSVAFWGFGEPLLHPQIVEMVALAKGLGAKTELITNGLLLDSRIAEGLVEAGLDTLVVSVDGASPEAYSDTRLGADLCQVQRNLSNLRAARHKNPRHTPEIGLEFVAMRRNVGELPKLPRLATAMGASFIVVTNLLPYTEELKDEILYGLRAGTSYPGERSKWTPEVILPRMDVLGTASTALAGLLRHMEVGGVQLRPWNRSPGYCRFVGEGSVAIAWDGGLSPCVALTHSYPCYVMGRRKLIRRWTLGNIAEQGIAELWQSEPYVQFRARVQRFDFAPCTDCGGCYMADSNEEDCYGNPFPVCGDCLWAKGVIQCP